LIDSLITLMCGIAAIFSYRDSVPVEAEELDRIAERMRQRGPDSGGAWIASDACVGLAHRRLAIIDLSPGGHQPMFADDGQLALVFNGEIYNYLELRTELEQAGVVFRSQSDSEVLLHLYRRHAAGMLDKLRGMYAFAIWDKRRKRLFAARDPLGIKPLYYSDDGKTVRIASQVKALLAGGRIDRTPNPAGHAGFFLWGHVPEPHTLYAQIHALPAGVYLIAEAGRPPQFHACCDIAEVLHAGVSGENVRSFDLGSLLRDTVRHHLVSDVPIGVFLSAGLDSCTLAALAVEQSAAPISTLTLGMEEFRGTPRDETGLAQKIAAHYGTRHSTVWLSERDLADEMDRLLTNMDQPSIDGVNTYFVSLAAARSGLKVALSGLGGDELFGGYREFRRIPRLVEALKPLRPLTPVWRALRCASAGLAERFASPKCASILEHGCTYPGAYLLTRSLFLPWELPKVLDPRVARDGLAALETFDSLERSIAGLETPRSKITALQMKWYMRNQLLRDSDWAGMAHSIEIRVPFVDLRLIQHLNGAVCGSNPPSKSSMAATPIRPVPREVLTRPKTGFGIPVDRWLASLRGKRYAGERGLRGWAQFVYQSQAGATAA
jgi:asparagine synthase (glutamine-hydrolysing)